MKVSFKEFLNITKALADENRLRMLMALVGGELCVCQITELMGLALSTVSKHLSVLYQAAKVRAGGTSTVQVDSVQVIVTYIP